MIQAGFFFPRPAKRNLLAQFLHLPGALRPTRMSIGEDEPGSVILEGEKGLDTLDANLGGFFLKSKNCSYSFDFFGKLPIKCTCFLELEASQSILLMTRLAAVGPLFGFACLPEEREAKNKVVNKLGINTIESWVGRDIDKALPGLYWCTLIPDQLAQKHGIPVASLSAAALEHLELGNGQHLFRFFERPEDWQDATDLENLSRSSTGIFKVERARAEMAEAKTFLELCDISQQWK